MTAGFLGPRPLEDQIEHARGFALAAPRPPAPAELACDLGSGGGLPGLVLAVDVWPGSRWVLLEGMTKRAEQVGRPGEPLRGGCALVTARAFGAPPVTAEAAAPLLATGGSLVVSEPPGSEGDRWPQEGLAPLGLVGAGVVRTERAGYMVLRQDTPCPPEYPRSWKRQARHPLFRS